MRAFPEPLHTPELPMRHLRLVVAFAVLDLTVLACLGAFLLAPDTAPRRPVPHDMGDIDPPVAAAGPRPLEWSPEPAMAEAEREAVLHAHRQATRLAAARRQVLAATTYAHHDNELRIYDVAVHLRTLRTYRSVEPRRSGDPPHEWYEEDSDVEGIDIEDLAAAIEETISPDDWSLPGRFIDGAGTSLIVRAPLDIHDRIVNLLADLLR